MFNVIIRNPYPVAARGHNPDFIMIKNIIQERVMMAQKMERNKYPPKYLFVLLFEIVNWTRISLDLTEYSNLQIVIACAGGTNIKRERKKIQQWLFSYLVCQYFLIECERMLERALHRIFFAWDTRFAIEVCIFPYGTYWQKKEPVDMHVLVDSFRIQIQI